jgi:hypothetical protein
MILKIWLNDAMIGCFLVVGAMEFFKIEEEILDDHEDELEEACSFKVTTRNDYINVQLEPHIFDIL